MRLELSRRARTDLDELRYSSVERFGAERTITYPRAIEHAFRRVLDNPRIGTAHERLGGVRSLPAGEHRVYYDVGDDAVTIVRVLHKAMDVGRHL